MLRIPTARLVVDGVDLVESWYRISQGMGAIDRAFERIAGKEDDFRTVDLDTNSLEILAMLNHPKRIDALVHNSDRGR